MAKSPRNLPAVDFRSSESDLEEGFVWARARAVEWVQTGDPHAIPSYWAGLTDRPLFYSRDVAHQAVGAHLLGLDLENKTMLTSFIASANERRGYYPLWSFTFDNQPAPIDYDSDDRFVREVPAVFELVEASLTQYLWTGDRAYVDDARFVDYYTNAVTSFVNLHDPYRRGIAGESGTKDIFVGTPSYNESPLGGGMNIAADGFASQWAALDTISRVLPESDFTRWAGLEASRLRSIFDAEWWDEGEGHYVAGFLGAEPIRGFAYEPSWFPAVKGLIDGARADMHLNYLSGQLAVTPPPNIEAFTYLPEAYFSAGQDKTALDWIRFLINSRADYPEVSYTVVAHLVAGLTGLKPLGPDTLETKTHLSDGWLEATSIPFGNRRLDLRHEGAGTSILSVQGGETPLRWIAHLDGQRVEKVVAPGDTVRVG